MHGIFSFICFERGGSTPPREIAERLAMARQSVNEALDGFEHRSRRPMIADNLREIRRLLSESRPVGE